MALNIVATPQLIAELIQEDIANRFGWNAEVRVEVIGFKTLHIGVNIHATQYVREVSFVTELRDIKEPVHDMCREHMKLI